MRIWSRVEPGIHSIDVHDFTPTVENISGTILIKQTVVDPTYQNLTMYYTEEQARALLNKLSLVLNGDS